MGRQNTSTLDGRVVGYGTRDSKNPYDAVVHTYGRLQQTELTIDFNTVSDAGLQVGTASTYGIELPNDAIIVSARLVTEDAWVGGTSLAIGTKQVDDGSVIDADGLFTAVELATANLTANTVLTGSAGAQLGTVLGQAAELAVTVVGTYTAGSARLLVEWEQPVVDDDAPAPLIGVQGSL